MGKLSPQENQERESTIRYHMAIGGFFVGQEGEFLLHDSRNCPIEKVCGKIVSLVEGQKALYAMLSTERGVRPGRLL